MSVCPEGKFVYTEVLAKLREMKVATPLVDVWRTSTMLLNIQPTVAYGVHDLTLQSWHVHKWERQGGQCLPLSSLMTLPTPQWALSIDDQDLDTLQLSRKYTDRSFPVYLSKSFASYNTSECPLIPGQGHWCPGCVVCVFESSDIVVTDKTIWV